jgi:hypothetical protein
MCTFKLKNIILAADDFMDWQRKFSTVNNTIKHTNSNEFLSNNAMMCFS